MSKTPINLYVIGIGSAFHATIGTSLKQEGFRPPKADPCLRLVVNVMNLNGKRLRQHRTTEHRCHDARQKAIRVCCSCSAKLEPLAYLSPQLELLGKTVVFARSHYGLVT